MHGLPSALTRAMTARYKHKHKHSCLLGYEAARFPRSFSGGPRQKHSGSPGHAVRESLLYSDGGGDKIRAINHGLLTP